MSHISIDSTGIHLHYSAVPGDIVTLEVAKKAVLTLLLATLLFRFPCWAEAQSSGETLAIFDKNAEQVAWFEDGNLFDLELQWIGFLDDNNFFNPETLVWLGPIHKGTLLDRSGKPVAWIEGSEPEGTLKPLKPLKPPRPPKPLKPLRPLVGWSSMQWQQWIAQDASNFMQ